MAESVRCGGELDRHERIVVEVIEAEVWLVAAGVAVRLPVRPDVVHGLLANNPRQKVV